MNTRKILFYAFLFLITHLNAQESKFFEQSKNIKEHGFSTEKLDTLVSFLKTSGTSSFVIISDKKTILETKQCRQRVQRLSLFTKKCSISSF